MTPKDLFERSRRGWFALVGDFHAYAIAKADGGADAGCQMIVALDVESGFIFDSHIADRAPAAWTAAELGGFLRQIFAKFERPREGVLIVPSVWRSAEWLYDEESTRERIKDVFALGFRWPEMAAAERSTLQDELKALGLALVWEEDDLPGYDDLTRALRG